MPSPDESLCRYLGDCCDRATDGLPPGRARETIAAVRGRLAGDLLRVAVGGRLNAGKSTLVNALLGEKLAATDATECTKLVSWFTFGLMNQVIIRTRSGQSVALPAQPLASAVAAACQPADEIEMIEVKSSNRILATQYTLVDTPGLDALSGLDDMSLAALAEADVLLYVMPHPGDNDEEALTSLRDRAGAAGITALSTIGVLSRIDQLGEGSGDPWPVARRHARAYSERLAGLVGTVLPVLGLIAETALGDRFTEADMAPLQALHRLSAADPDALETALYGADDFLTLPDLPLTLAERQRLLALLGIYGVKVALGELDGGCQGAAALLAALRAHSGIDPLLGQLSRQFIGLADPLRARRAIQALDAVTWLGGSPAEVAVLARLREEVDAARQHPRLRQFALQDSLSDLRGGRWQAPDGIAAELSALVNGVDLPSQLGLDPSAKPEEVKQLLLTRITAWKLLENASRTTYRHARGVREYLEFLYLSLPPG